jgi:hypothetical protein
VKAFIRETFEGEEGAGRPASTVPQISREELKETLDRGEPMTLVEALPEMYYRRAHLPGALNIPVERVIESGIK